MTLKERVAIVTGGARGIGKAISQSLIQDGAHLVISDVNLGEAKQTADELATSGRRCLAVGADVTDGKGVAGMVDRAIREFGRIDILINNAGITRDGLLLRMKEEDWDLVLNVNLKGAFHCTKSVLPLMSKQRRGRIVNIASIVGVMGNAGQANYAASKAALIGFTKSVAREYAGRGITANAVAPGFIDTAMTQNLSSEVREGLMKQIPLGRLGTPQDIAHAVRFLVSEEAGYITGHVLHVNGGMLMV
ncbi:MAG TPA: 3-oxoacyl-[acyl-carrier-protein] reductase [Nitrospiria bacterium]|jgi:3-oxoacyl-[acyl-carrier protein] reductase|nr:3-oxoacyl-[acyl-carrier-protein] reductase [Nitrospiria bacterium]